MKKTNFLKSVAALAATASLCTLMTGAIPSNNHKNYFTNSITANAASISRDLLNGNDMFFVQDETDNCTHASITMLLKRVSRINGGDYASITQDSTRSTVWTYGVGADNDGFTYQGMYIDYCNKNVVYNQLSKYNGSRKELFKALLKEHPEGIVAYDSWHLAGGGDYPSLWYPQAPNQVADDRPTDHAILLTDYDEATDTFYAADPAYPAVAKRIKLSETTRNHIDYFDTYWYYTGTLKNEVINSKTPTTTSKTTTQTTTKPTTTTTTTTTTTNTNIFYRVYDVNGIRLDSFKNKSNAYNLLKLATYKGSVPLYITINDGAPLTGDLDLNGVVELTDLTYLSLYLLGDRTFETIASSNGIANPDVVKFNADVNRNGSIDIADMATLKNIIVNG